jgi:arylsulfatase A-like enzyme
MGFVLLHYSIPHPPGIFNRRTGHVSPEVGANYLDNLALADQCLAGIRATLEQQGEWDSSTVVVMGDHGWRTTMFWKIPGGAWTAEEDAASHGGVFDTRPAYIVKLPGQTAPARIDSLFRAFHTRELLDRIMTNQLKTPADLAAFAARVR